MKIFFLFSKGWAFVALVILAIVFPIGASFYKYYFKKNYDFLIEAKCNPLEEICFTRDCTNPDDCPPNGLSEYKVFLVKAYDFSKCKDNSCEEECNKELIQCVPVLCGDSPEDTCTELQQ